MNVPQPTNRASVSRSFDSGSGHAVRNWSICILMCLLIMSVVCIGGGMVVNEIVKWSRRSGHEKCNNYSRHINVSTDSDNYEYSTPDQNSADLQSEQGPGSTNYQGRKHHRRNGDKHRHRNSDKHHGPKSRKHHGPNSRKYLGGYGGGLH
eukprot:67826_1